MITEDNALSVEGIVEALVTLLDKRGCAMIARQQQIFINGEWKDAHSSTAQEFPLDQVRFAEPVRPEMPNPVGTYADHSYPLYTRAQMLKAMLDSAALVLQISKESK